MLIMEDEDDDDDGNDKLMLQMGLQMNRGREPLCMRPET